VSWLFIALVFSTVILLILVGLEFCSVARYFGDSLQLWRESNWQSDSLLRLLIKSVSLS